MSRFPVSIKKSSGRPVQAGNLELTPISQALVVRLPGLFRNRLPPSSWPGRGGLVWNRPVAVRVQAPGEAARILPVYDYTRLAQFLVLGAGLLGSTLIWLVYRGRRR